ncbi:WD40-repeat-containing domain protein [Thermothelomyces heterothallicus CBS 202.75]|uniref:WD40-repeat-containing domain protein n=1 Tax=Thermothelomyces heterothallicus CBS 202.75 TaxID=1149848 RepID=UPI0037445DB8
MAEGLTRVSSEVSRNNAAPVGEVARDRSKKGGGSFLSRLGMRPGKKKDLVDLDSDSELGGEARMDGVNARVFSQTLGSPLVGGGYVPHHKEPPRYIRTRSSNKRTREFNRVFLAQELVGTRPPENDEDAAAEAGKAPMVSVSMAGAGDRRAVRSGGAIWASEFSKDGRFLATGGRDYVVRVWAVLSTAEERRAHEEDEVAGGDAGERLSAPVFREQPVMEFKGHTGEVLDLSWSKNNFLLSSSMDKTVRLWHMSRSECLCTFKHKDFVTRLAFHPRDDRFFLAGSLDTMLRLWSIPDKAVAFSAQLPDLVTAVAFSPDGKVAIAGLLNGYCMFYETEGLKLSSQIHVRSSRGKNAKGSKITGIQTMTIPPPNPLDTGTSQAPDSDASVSAAAPADGTGVREEVRVLITSNDSRVRVYNLHDKSLLLKLKGHENACSQIAATFSDDGKHIICGSEDRKTFIWSLTGGSALVQDKDKPPCEYFEAHGDIVTTALFAPTKTRMLLGQSGDPIYDLCNPPPVVLQSLEEAAGAAASQVALTNDSQQSRPHEPVGKRPEPSPAYIARSTHYDGHIIITTGDTGIIKVFRQDCAYAKRRHESWETGSTFSRKLGAGGVYIGGGLGRSGSVLTRTSAGSTAHSRRGSLSQPVPPSVLGSPQFHAVGAHPDRILSWRQGIEHGGDRRSALLADGSSTPARSERSLSPAKASGTSLNSAYNLASEGRKQPYGGASPARNRANSALTSPTASVLSSPPERRPSRSLKESALIKQRRTSKPQEEPSVPPTPGFTLYSASAEGADQSPQSESAAGAGSTSFWNLGLLRAITAFKTGSSSQGGASTRTKSIGSRPSLSISRQHGDSSCDEREGSGGQAEGGGGIAASRRQSAGGDGKSRGRKSLPGGSSLQEGSDSDAPSVPVNGGETENRGSRD